jgi:hypothetical protein
VEIDGGRTPGVATPLGSLVGSPALTSKVGENGGQQEQLTPPLAMQEEDLDADHDEDVPLRPRAIDNILGLAAVPQGLARRVLSEELHVVSSDKPSSFSEVENDPCWRRAMLEEMKSIEDNGTWSLVHLPQGRMAIGLKWVFKVKRDEQGNIAKHKARLVMKGYA